MAKRKPQAARVRFGRFSSDRFGVPAITAEHAGLINSGTPSLFTGVIRFHSCPTNHSGSMEKKEGTTMNAKAEMHGGVRGQGTVACGRPQADDPL